MGRPSESGRTIAASFSLSDCCVTGSFSSDSSEVSSKVKLSGTSEAKSLAPDGTPCRADKKGLLKRAHIVAGELRYIGKETDRKWEEGDDISVLEFKTTEYGRSKMVFASEEVKKDIKNIGINKCARESGFDRKNFIRKLDRDIPVKRNSYAEFERWLQSYKSQMGSQIVSQNGR
jgi:hypothetical protein